MKRRDQEEQRGWWRPVVPYAVAIAITLAAFALRLALQEVLLTRVPYITFYPAVVLSAAIGGLGPGLLSILISGFLASFSILEPAYRWGIHDQGDMISLVFFVILAGFLAWMQSLLADARKRAESAEEEERARRQELELAHRETRRNRDLLQTTLASIGDGVISTDAHGLVTFENPVAAALTGCSPEDALGRPIEELFPILDETSGAPVENPVRKVLKEKTIAGLANHTILVRRDGQRFSIDDTAAPICSADGAIAGAVLVFRDITERRRQQKAFSENEERLRIAVDAGGIGVWDWKIEDNTVDWTDWVHQIHGVSKAEFGGKLDDFVRLVHPDDLDRVNRAIERAIQDVEDYALEFRIIQPGGEVRWVATTGRVIRNQGRPIRMLGATIDVTERHKTETAQRESEARLQLALEVGRMGTWDWDMVRNQVKWSDGHFTLHGLEPGSVEPDDQLWQKAVLPEDAEAARKAMEKASRERSLYQAEYRTRWPDGSIHWMDARGRFFYDPGGKPVRMLGVIVEVTKRKEAEQALLRANEELHQFAHAASHDLQEPLRTIAIYTELLMRRGGAQPQHSEMLSNILSCARQMQALIDGISELSRAGAPGDLRQVPVDAGHVLGSTLSSIQATINEHEADVEYTGLPTVSCDPDQIQRVFQNLVVNAVKYRRPGVRPQVRVTAAKSGHMWRFAVADNGQGFHPQYSDRVFLPFKRLHGSDVPGSGIGLAVCKRIVERHGGSIWAESEPGSGTTFYFTLPDAGMKRAAVE